MAIVIFASALGVIIITGGLFLRRLLGDIAELRRQITGIDRQMRAQRAHVTALRQLLAEPDTELPREAAVSGSPAPLPPPRPDPVRRKKHLGLHLGGPLAIVVAAGSAIREALHSYRGHLAGAISGAAITGTTVTALAIAPWMDSADHIGPQPAAPPGQSTLWVPPPHPSHGGTTEPVGSPASVGPPSSSSSAAPVSPSEPDVEDITPLEPADEPPPAPLASLEPDDAPSGSPGPIDEVPAVAPETDEPTESPPPTPPVEPGPCLTGMTPTSEDVCPLGPG